MPMNVSRWLKYAKARLDDTVKSSNEELDRLEAKREAEAADRPWLRPEGDTPTLDEATARIAWETERQAKAEAEVKAKSQAKARGSAASGPDGSRAEADDGDDHDGVATSSRGPFDPVDAADAAARSTARLELDQRAKESAERLEQIRRELGVDDPPSPPPEAPKR